MAYYKLKTEDMDDGADYALPREETVVRQSAVDLPRQSEPALPELSRPRMAAAPQSGSPAQAAQTRPAGAYEQRIDELLAEISARPEFRYDFNADSLYDRYRDSYSRQAQLAMLDTVAAANAATGGYGSSYAVSAGSQSYQNKMAQLDDILPKLYDMALDRYRLQGDELYDRLSAYTALQKQEDSREQSRQDYELAMAKLREQQRQFDAQMGYRTAQAAQKGGGTKPAAAEGEGGTGDTGEADKTPAEGSGETNRKPAADLDRLEQRLRQLLSEMPALRPGYAQPESMQRPALVRNELSQWVSAGVVSQAEAAELASRLNVTL